MSNLAEVIKFPEQEQEQGREYVKADVDNGYYRVANELGLALCNVRLSDRESRLVHAIMMKTFGWQKPMDWVCYDQLAEMTGIDVTNIGKTKTALVKRKILVVDGKKTGINPIVSEWLNKSEPTQNKTKKTSQNRLMKKSEPTHEKVRTDSKASQNRLTQKKYTKPKDNITKDSELILPNWLPSDLWLEFVAMRKLIKRPLTEQAIVRMINKLVKFHEQGIDACAQLTYSIDNCYSDVYAPKNFQNNTFRAKSTPENFDLKDYGETQIPAWMED